MKRIFVLLFLPLIVGYSFTADSLIVNNLYETTKHLSSCEFQGRLAGTAGYDKAAHYVANIFNNLGLLRLENGTYFQEFNLESNEILPGFKFEILPGGKDYKLGKDFVFRGFTGGGDIENSEVVFCGYGLYNPENGYDDYSGVDVKGKVVLVFKQNPSWRVNDKILGGGYPREKAKVAFERGAIGLIMVSTPNANNPQQPIGSVFDGKGIQLEEFPQLHISLEVAMDLLSGTKLSLSRLQSIIDSTKKPLSVKLKNRVTIKVDTRYNPLAKSMNVVGVLEGVDKEKRSEYIVLGAHLDHVGVQGGEVLYPGANDNASGCAVVLELAKIFSKDRLNRSVIFVLFSAEEKGLDGSEYFVSNSPIPISNIKWMLNFDCVGYGDSLQIGNGKSAVRLWELARGIDLTGDRITIENTWGGGGADATAFHNAGIPSLYFATHYSYTHLHLPSDTYETLNYDLMSKIVKLTERLVRVIDKNED